MTLNSAPWAIDGARTPAALARLASYAGGGGRSGIVQPADMRVTALAVPGNGLRVGQGASVVLNGYLTNPDEAYVVSNPGTHTVLPQDMPAPQGSIAHYLVCVVIGDPAFNQTGHPFMPAGPLDPVEALSFEYNRIVLIPCSANTTNFESLGLSYPGYALARLEVPANTSTITNAMITDLRGLATPRSHPEFIVETAVGNDLSSSVDVAWPINAPWIDVPRWATHVVATATLSSIVAFGSNVAGMLRAQVGTLSGFNVGYDIDSPSGATRETFVLGVSGDCSSFAGQRVQLKTIGANWDAANGHLHTWGGTQVIWNVQFYERPI